MALVESIIGHLGALGCSELVVFTDRPGENREKKPPRIGGFVPDVFAAEYKGNAKVIGEAKSFADFYSPHTTSQISAFAEYLSYQSRGVLILAVPASLIAAARNLLTTVKASFSGQSIEVACSSGSVLTWLPQDAPA